MHFAGWQIEIRATVVAGHAGGAARGGLLRAAKPGALRPATAAGLDLRTRTLLLIALVAAPAGLKVSRETPRQFVVLAVDQSRSVAADSAKIVQPFLDAAAGQGRGDRAVCLPFAAEPGELAEHLAPPAGEHPPGTDLAAAITAARAAIPAGYVPQIVLFSDGNQTDGDALAAARAAGVPVSTVPLPGPEHEVYVAAVAAPVAVRQGEPFDVDVTIQSTHDDACTVELRSRIAIAWPAGEGRTSTGAKTTSAFPSPPPRTGRP